MSEGDRPMRRSFLWVIGGKVLKIAVILYAVLAAFAWFFSEKLIFLPQPSSYRAGGDVFMIKTSDDVELAAVYVAAKEPKYTILFSHGNADDIGRLGRFFRELAEEGYSVLAWDYRGFGRSGGKSTEKTTYSDIDAVYDHLVKVRGVPPEQIIAMGHSLGAAVAIDLASRKKVAGLVAASGFTTAFRVMTVRSILPFDRFPSIDKIDRVACPVLIVHGEADTVISPSHGRELLAKVRSRKQSLFIPGAGHNDVFDHDSKAWTEALREFASSLGTKDAK